MTIVEFPAASNAERSKSKIADYLESVAESIRDGVVDIDPDAVIILLSGELCSELAWVGYGGDPERFRRDCLDVSQIGTKYQRDGERMKWK